MTKFFWVFAGDNYYPRSGLGDYYSHHTTLEEAESSARKALANGRDWVSVITHEDDGHLYEVLTL